MRSTLPFARTLVFTLAACLLGAAPAHAVIYDLTSDWSNINNPNGVWSLHAGDDLLPFQQAWSNGQGAWADAPAQDLGHVPAWLQAQDSFINDPILTNNLPMDFQVGDIAVHGSCCSSFNNARPANVKWTSDVNGQATISGSTWWGGFLARNVDWKIFINGVEQAGGRVGDGLGFTRANRFDFADGAADPANLSFFTSVGDVVMFQAASIGVDHFIGVDLTIEVREAPEPLSISLLALGLIGAAASTRKGRTPA